jgi:hypothetical protein
MRDTARKRDFWDIGETGTPRRVKAWDTVGDHAALLVVREMRSLIRDGAADDASVFDGAARDFAEGFLDHHFFAGVAADDGVGGLFDVANFVGVEDKGLAIKARETDHGDHPCKNDPRDSRINTCREGIEIV